MPAGEVPFDDVSTMYQVRLSSIWNLKISPARRPRLSEEMLRFHSEMLDNDTETSVPTLSHGVVGDAKLDDDPMIVPCSLFGGLVFPSGGVSARRGLAGPAGPAGRPAPCWCGHICPNCKEVIDELLGRDPLWWIDRSNYRTTDTGSASGTQNADQRHDCRQPQEDAFMVARCPVGRAEGPLCNAYLCGHGSRRSCPIVAPTAANVLESSSSRGSTRDDLETGDVQAALRDPHGRAKAALALIAYRSSLADGSPGWNKS
jgi:hypothetical protein